MPFHKSQAKTDWEAEGRAAILDLLGDRLVVPWHEAESRISGHGWKDFPKVQPLQLTRARQQLVTAKQIVLEHTRHSPPVVTIRVPSHSNVKALARLRGGRRKLYRRYLKWTADEHLCGKHAENLVYTTAMADASNAGLWVPAQAVGRISVVQGNSIAPKTLDVIVHILNRGEISLAATLIIEVKNVHSWLYPWDEEVWELLVKAALLATKTPVVPVLVCSRAAYSTWQMAQDIGFFTIQTTRQVFHPDVPADEFSEVVDEFALHIERVDGPTEEHVSNFFRSTLRRSPLSPPNEDIEWFQRQASRFAHLAPHISRFAALAGSMAAGSQRSHIWDAARGALKSELDWTPVGGW